MERFATPEPKSISFPDWVLTLTDHFCKINGKNRSEIAVSGCKKAIIHFFKVGNLCRYLTGNDLSLLRETTDVSVKIPSFLYAKLLEHCENSGTTPEVFIKIAVIKYLLSKDDPESFWDYLYMLQQQGEKDFFKSVLT